ncbi:MAG: dTDP-4-dehydrorhamnose 3,5-epimerase [Flavobacteriales bacterium]|nr:dTDP-4-dehydrorhamnose 3,5-epimerase [Flavobacteriales bacterium]
MNAIPTKLKDCFILEPRVFNDQRGFFYESFNENAFKEATKLNVNFVQDNIAKSSYGVVRGLHMQRPPFAQAKLLHVYQGRILDVAVDVRENSPTYGEFVAVELSDENKRQLFVPRGFLHGYSVLSETALVGYKCDGFYNKESENGINPLCEQLGIDWGIPKEKMIISEKDQNTISLSDIIPVKL